MGSEEGIRRIGAGEVDFGASDMPLSAKQLQEKGKLLQFATVLGAVVPIYNVKGAPDGLNLTPEVLAGIFLGRIVSWNAREIRAINRHVRLPDEKIAVLRRSDDSGTTYAWTDYLSKVNEEWKSKVGTGATMPWPVGAGAQRNQGVANTMAKTANSIGYVEFIYALQHELNFAAVRNSTGEYVKADLDSVTAAAKAAAGSRKIVCGTQERGISHSADSVRNDGSGFQTNLAYAFIRKIHSNKKKRWLRPALFLLILLCLRLVHFEGEGVVADQAGHLVVADVHADDDAIAGRCDIGLIEELAQVGIILGLIFFVEQPGGHELA